MNKELENLLKEAYVFLGMRHKALSPWGNAIENWINRLEKETNWNHYKECEEYEMRRNDKL